MKNWILIIIFITGFFLSCGENHYRGQNPQKIRTQSDSNNLSENKSNEETAIKVAISAMISPKETFSLYEELLKYIEKKLGVSIKLKQRKSYQEVNNLLKEGNLDFAFICSGAYVVAKREFPLELLAAPLVNGKPFYQAYIIANKKSKIENFEDFKGKSFAFTDPLSNTGYKYALKLLDEQKYSTENFFNNTIFTYAHDYSIQAVARELVDGASIDGLVYEYLLENHPERVEEIKVISKSENFGIPPFVYTSKSDTQIIARVREILLNMHNNPDGKKILKKMKIDKFEIVSHSNYKSIEEFN